MKSHEETLFLSAYTDVYTLAGATPDPRDLKTVACRIETEGLSFLTITLPIFARALERALERGRWDCNDALGFKTLKHRGRLPAFLQGLTSLVFDSDGVLHSEPLIVAVWGIRQLCLLYKKIELPCTQQRQISAVKKYVLTDSEVKPVRALAQLDVARLEVVFSALYQDVLQKVDHAVYYANLVPGHGPGAVAERLSYNGKFRMEWYERLSPSFPPDKYICSNLGADNSIGNELVEVGRERPARVTCVPKTLKTPRLIAIEPACIQYTQQALMRSVNAAIAASAVSGCLNVDDQSPNGLAALKGSLDGSIATLDLSEASDRVGAGLVSRLTRRFPHFREALFRARSSRVLLPEFYHSDVVRLKKFASMGSSMCFPIEAMVFLAIVTLGIATAKGTNLTRKRLLNIARDVKVFGDDIIVPKRQAPNASLALEYFGLRVNSDKSFSKGDFRESCGIDAYRGCKITPVYVRMPLQMKHSDAEGLVAGTSLCNQLFAAGLWRASDYVRRLVESACKKALPNVLETSSVLGLVTPWRSTFDTHKMCPKLHRPLVKGILVKMRLVPDPLDGYQALLKVFLEKNAVRPKPKSKSGYNLAEGLARSSLQIAPSFHGLKLTHGWCTPY